MQNTIDRRPDLVKTAIHFFFIHQNEQQQLLGHSIICITVLDSNNNKFKTQQEEIILPNKIIFVVSANQINKQKQRSPHIYYPTPSKANRH